MVAVNEPQGVHTCRQMIYRYAHGVVTYYSLLLFLRHLHVHTVINKSIHHKRLSKCYRSIDD